MQKEAISRFYMNITFKSAKGLKIPVKTLSGKKEQAYQLIRMIWEGVITKERALLSKSTGIANINPNHRNCARPALKQALLITEYIKSICHPQQPFLGRSNESSIIYVRTKTSVNTQLAIATVVRDQPVNACKHNSKKKLTSCCCCSSNTCLLYTSPSPRDS